MRYPSVALIAVALALLPASAHSDQPPSLSETDAWLQSHLPSAAMSGDGYVTESVEASYTAVGCSLRLRVTTRFSSGLAPSGSIYHLDFLPATGAAFLMNESQVTKEVLHGDATIRYRDISPTGVKITDVGADRDDGLPPIEAVPKLLRFTFDDRDMALRVERAMLHAISLCGGKAEPF